MKTAALVLAFTSFALPITTAHADIFLDLTSVTPGSSGVGSFSGTSELEATFWWPFFTK